MFATLDLFYACFIESHSQKVMKPIFLLKKTTLHKMDEFMQPIQGR